MRYTDSPASYTCYSSIFKRLMVTFNYCSNRFDSLRCSNIGQEYQSRVRNPSQVNQLREVLVHSDEDSTICSRLFQQCPVARVRAEGLRFNDIVSVVAQPLGQSASGASVYQEPHGAVTETGARVSPAITVWA